MRVRFTPRAARQLDVILADIKKANPEAAKALRQRVEEVRERVSLFPEGFQEVDERKGVRRIPLTPFPHIVFYRVSADEVEVVAVVHGARQDLLDDL